MNMMSPLARAGRPDASVSRAWLAALETTSRATRDPARILPRAAEEWAVAFGDRVALVSDVETLSYRQLLARVNVYARWALRAGIGKGDAVALMMRNRPDYFALWLGLTRVGAIAALVSPDLKSAALAHALKVSRATRLIVDGDLADLASVACRLSSVPLPICVHEGERAGLPSLQAEIAGLDDSPLAAGEGPHVTLDDRALRIFTSGTTGLPKAAEVSHRRIVVWSHWFAGLAGLRGADRHYNCLPMHHSVGGVVAVGAPLVNGGSVAIAERFSASRFFDDVARFECTSFQYIGELCRYLAAAPQNSGTSWRGLRLALGNGLNPDVWRAMLDRFGPIRVLEFYASTEGNVWLYNVEGRVGALGRSPPYLAARDSIALVKFDPDAQAPLRGPDGFCVRCEDGETGEAIGRIGAEASQRFEGYSDASETEKKILRNVFAAGDAWMRTGDLMRRDADGFYAFVDRIGDTFRWKGENVATLEVAGVCGAQAGVDEAIVFGVEVFGAEGRAGMAVLKTSGPLDMAAFALGMESLPRYARPVFLRLVGEIAKTETHKPKRGVYVNEGFDPSKVDDPLFVYDAERRTYEPLDAQRYEAIANGRMRL
jgi:fatty-acyl-CoA synthase